MIAYRSCEFRTAKRPVPLRLEIVANSPLCHDVLGLGGIALQLLADAADMHVHRADIALVVVAPDEIEQVFPGIDPVRVADEKVDEIEFLGRQIRQDPVAVGVAADKIQPDGAGFDLLRLGLPEAGPAQQRPDSGLELQDVEGLGQIGSDRRWAEFRSISSFSRS